VTNGNCSAGDTASRTGAGPGHDRRAGYAIDRSLAGLRLDQALATLLPEHSRARLQRWVREGRVRVNDATVEPRHKVWYGDRVEVEPGLSAGEEEHRPEAIALDIVHEDDALLVVDKPAGLVVHPGSGNRHGTMLNALLHHVPALAGLPRAGIVHRLDKETSGLLVVAKTLPAQTALVRQLQARSVLRAYLAIVQGELAAGGQVEAPLGRHPVQRTRMAVVAGGKPALTRYRVLERLAGATLLECRLATGRTHQIRVHMESIGHPLLGDPVYARRRAPGGARVAAVAAALGRQALHAARLGFVHPEHGGPVSFESPLPADLRRALDALRP
jgi:23S rRNA pseudouridine1911/1915/1917 synthase